MQMNRKETKRQAPTVGQILSMVLSYVWQRLWLQLFKYFLSTNCFCFFFNCPKSCKQSELASVEMKTENYKMLGDLPRVTQIVNLGIPNPNFSSDFGMLSFVFPNFKIWARCCDWKRHAI